MSDLIERYGYERAVRELKAMDDRAIWMISSCLKYREEVRKECLEYRRANNIFEVGDKVVSIDKYSNDMIFTVAELTSKNVFTSMEFGEIAYSFVRHAKAEEIKAGKRLEVNQ